MPKIGFPEIILLVVIVVVITFLMRSRKTR